MFPEGVVLEVRMAEYELQQFEVSRTESRGAVRKLLTEHAEYGGWELARRKAPGIRPCFQC